MPRAALALVALVILALLAWWQVERARVAPDRAPVRKEEAVPDDVSERKPQPRTCCRIRYC